MLDFCYWANALLLVHCWLAPHSQLLSKVGVHRLLEEGLARSRHCMHKSSHEGSRCRFLSALHSLSLSALLCSSPAVHSMVPS